MDSFLDTRTSDAQILRAQLAPIRKAKSRIDIEQPYVPTMKSSRN